MSTYVDAVVTYSPWVQQSLKRIDDVLSKFPKLVDDVEKKTLQDHAKNFQAIHTKAYLSGRPGLSRRTGGLARSFSYVVESDADTNRLRYFSTSKYAKKQEDGGLVKPNGKKYLAIPVGPALTPAGVARYSSPRNVPAEFTFKSKGIAKGLRRKTFTHTESGKLVFMRKKGGKPFLGRVENGKVVVYFLLREQVNIPARLNLKGTWRDMVPTIYPRLAHNLEQEVKNRLK